MMLSSFRPDAELTHSPIALWPHQLTLIHHIELLRRTNFIYNLRDSLVVASGAVALGLALALPAAYAFSRFRFRGRQALRTQFLVINMFPVVMLILPLFVLMRDLGLLDTYFALIAGHATFTLPFAIWLLTSYVDGIPPELDQAAMIDGATRVQALRLVVLPLAHAGRGGSRHLPVHHVVERIPVRADAGRPQCAHRDGGAAVVHRREPDPMGTADGRGHAGGAARDHPVPVRAAASGGRPDRRSGEGMNPIGVISMSYARPFTAAHFPLFARMKAAGMDFCELLVPEPGELDPAEARRAARDAGLFLLLAARVNVQRDLASDDAAARKAGVDYLRRCIDVAAACGATIVGGPLYGTPLVFAGRPPTPIEEALRRERVKRVVDGLASGGGTRRGRDVGFAIEPLNRFETDFCNTAQQALALCAQVDHPAVGIMLDTFHMNMEEDDLPQAIRHGGTAADPFPGEREPSRLPWYRPYRLAADLPCSGGDQLSGRDHSGAVPPHRPSAVDAAGAVAAAGAQ